MIVGIDMDGVIADFVTPAVRNIKDKFGIDITEEDLVNARGSIAKLVEGRINPDDHETLQCCLPINMMTCIRDRIAPQGFFWALKPYEGAIQAVFDICDAGNRVVFITKTYDWLHSISEKKFWIEKYFETMSYEFIAVDNMKSKGLVNVDVMIDDDERVIEAMHEDVIKILVRQPQNKLYRESAKQTVSFIEVDSLEEAAKQIISWT